LTTHPFNRSNTIALLLLSPPFRIIHAMLKGFILGFALLVAGMSAAQTVDSGSRYPFSYKNRQIIVGKGGGTTGASTAYYLLENGYLYARSDSDSLFTRLGKIPATTTRRLFRELEMSCRIKTTQFSKPGNIYQFVGWKKNRQEYKVTWGDYRQPPPTRFVQFYKSFMAVIPAQ
jgi:hypothetical protein